MEYVLSFFCILTALGVIIQKRPLYSGVWLFAASLFIAGIYFYLNVVHFGALQIIIFASSIVVISALALMLNNFNKKLPRSINRDYFPVASGFLGALLFGILLLFMESNFNFGMQQSREITSLEVFKFFVERNGLVFELAGLLLFGSTIATLYILKKEKR